MTFEETKELLVEIYNLYPSFRITGTDMIQAWGRRLTTISKDRAFELLDEWLEGAKSDYPPKVDFFIKGRNTENTKKAFWTDKPIVFHVEHGFLLDQDGREYGDPDLTGEYKDGSAPYEILNSRGERIQWMDQRGYIHNGRGVFFKVEKETA